MGWFRRPSTSLIESHKVKIAQAQQKEMERIATTIDRLAETVAGQGGESFVAGDDGGCAVEKNFQLR